ncbi:MAG TPA: hypothetical protein VFI04_00755 [Gaiellaceae bacterium]|nr:hypothetical protein [Gaiellaceae bacterium]
MTAIVGLVGIATLLGLLDRYLWVLELADVFRLQYLAVLVAVAPVALALRRPRLAAAAGALAVLNAVVVGISFAPPAAAASGPASGNLRLLVATSRWATRASTPSSASSFRAARTSSVSPS